MKYQFIKVIPNYKLESLILSFGDRVKVLEPEGFRVLIGRRLEKAAGELWGLIIIHIGRTYGTLFLAWLG